MATTNTDYSWFWYVRKKGARYYLGLVDQNGDAPTSAYTIDIYYDEIPYEFTSGDDTFPIPAQFEMGIIKGVAAELMAMSSNQALDISLRRDYERVFEQTVLEGIHYQTEEASQPTVIKPLDLRDDDIWSSR
jgi:hypothetical protein